MGANIELWAYRFFSNQTLYLEEVFQKAYLPSGSTAEAGKNPVMVAAGKKAAITAATATYAFEQHLKNKSKAIRGLAMAVQEFVTGLDPAIEEVPKKHYVAYKTSQNIVCMEVQKQKIHLYLKLDPKKTKGPKALIRDVSEVGHFGTGDVEVTVRTDEDLQKAKPYVEMAYRRVGG